MPLFPWIEQNQGFLSLLALIAALAIALWEWWLRVADERRRLDADANIAIDIVNKVQVALASVPRPVDGSNWMARPEDRAAIRELQEQARFANESLDRVAGRVHTAFHALMLQQAIERLRHIESASDVTYIDNVLRGTMEEHLRVAREGLVAARRAGFRG